MSRGFLVYNLQRAPHVDLTLRVLEQNPSTHSIECSPLTDLSPDIDGAVDELLGLFPKDEAGDGSTGNLSGGFEEGEYGGVECLSRWVGI